MLRVMLVELISRKQAGETVSHKAEKRVTLYKCRGGKSLTAEGPQRWWRSTLRRNGKLLGTTDFTAFWASQRICLACLEFRARNRFASANLT